MKNKLQGRIAVLSDGTGETAETFVNAILAQFKIQQQKIQRHPQIKSEAQLEKLIAEFEPPFLVTYTFASEKLRKAAWALVRDRGLTGIDLLYPAVEIFSSFLQESPTQERGAFHTTQAEDYFQRIEAIEFTVKHDDGMKMNELHLADLILVGVSRSSKTPTSIYLAHKGYKVANVPLVPGIELSPDLIRASESGIPVIFLTINAMDLERIRKVRFQNLGARLSRSDNYISSVKIREELEATRQLARRHKWPILDVTDKAIEETASEILLLVTHKSS